MHPCWRPIAGAPGYECSTDGQVRNARTGVVLKPYPSGKSRYPKVTLGSRAKGGKRWQQYVHTLVLLTFVGPRPTGHEGDHINFDRWDARLSNLRWLPREQNTFRWHRHQLEHEALLAETTPPVLEAEAEAIERELVAAGW